MAHYSVDLTIESLQAPAEHSGLFSRAKTWPELWPEPVRATRKLHIRHLMCPSTPSLATSVTRKEDGYFREVLLWFDDA